MKELKEIEYHIWYDYEDKELYYERDNGDLKFICSECGVYEENPFDTVYYYDYAQEPFYIEYVAGDDCEIVSLNDVYGHDTRKEFEMLYLRGYFDFDNNRETIEVDEERWAFVFDHVINLPIFYNYEDCGETEIAPQFDKEEDIQYYTLLNELRNEEYLNRYNEKLQEKLNDKK